MRSSLMAFGAGLVLVIQSVNAQDICGEAPSLSDPAISRGVTEAIQVFRIWSGSGESFARFAADQYRRLAKGRSPDEARLIAVALLHAECLELTRDQDPARLPWHFKDRLVGLSKLVPDFREAYAVLERIKTAETRR
jgi:hypothetical protein